MDVWDDDEDDDRDRQTASTRDTERLRQKHYNVSCFTKARKTFNLKFEK
jgi:hypothetical protein